jgi:ornithine carbamoyltransferase
MKKDLLTILDLSKGEILGLIRRARELKALHRQGQDPRPLLGKTLAMIFDKPSTRTRVSFEVGMAHLGGTTIYLERQHTQMARNEPMADTARVLSRYVDGVVMRTFAQERLAELARHADIPIINGLTDTHHPCQVLSDLMTIEERFGKIDGLHIAWIGDGNNMANSWITAALRLDFALRLACPPGYEPDAALMRRAEQEKRQVFLDEDPRRAATGAQVINTDVWASMGQEGEAATRQEAFWPYQVSVDLMTLAPSEAIVLHCLPAHRGEEITDEVLDGPQSAVWDQAENRLHFQKALLEWLLGAEPGISNLGTSS